MLTLWDKKKFYNLKTINPIGYRPAPFFENYYQADWTKI